MHALRSGSTEKAETDKPKQGGIRNEGKRVYLITGDLIIRRSGKAKKLTVEFGGFLDIGDKLVALPFSPSRFLASAVMNRHIINEEGKRVGRVKDLVINRKNNRVEKIILSSIDILGEDVHVALSYEPLGFTAYGLVYDITLHALKDFIYPYEE